MKNSEESLKNLRDTIKWTKMHIMGVPEGEERKDRKLKEEKKKKWLKVLKLGKERDNLIQEIQKDFNRMDPKVSTCQKLKTDI